GEEPPGEERHDEQRDQAEVEEHEAPEPARLVCAPDQHEEGEVAVEEVAGQEEEHGGEDPGERPAAHGPELAPADEEDLGHFSSWGPVQCSGASRAPRFRVPRTPSASSTQRGLGPPVCTSWGPHRW